MGTQGTKTIIMKAYENGSSGIIEMIPTLGELEKSRVLPYNDKWKSQSP